MEGGWESWHPATATADARTKGATARRSLWRDLVPINRILFPPYCRLSHAYDNETLANG